MMSSTTNSPNTSFGRVADQTADSFRDAATNTADAARRAGQELGAAARTEFNNILTDLAGPACGRPVRTGRRRRFVVRPASWPARLQPAFAPAWSLPTL